MLCLEGRLLSGSLLEVKLLRNRYEVVLKLYKLQKLLGSSGLERHNWRIISAFLHSVSTCCFMALLEPAKPRLPLPLLISFTAMSLFFHSPELYKARVLELNASDDRGINLVRTKIKNLQQLLLVLVSKGVTLAHLIKLSSLMKQIP